MQWPSPNRRLFLCCVRLSAEKQPRTFVAVAAALSRRGTFRKLALQPVLLAASSSPYAQVRCSLPHLLQFQADTSAVPPLGRSCQVCDWQRHLVSILVRPCIVLCPQLAATFCRKHIRLFLHVPRAVVHMATPADL